MSAVQAIPTPTVFSSPSPDRHGAGLISEPPASAGVTPPPLITHPRATGHFLPTLTPDQDRLFEALAKGQTSPAELSATLNLPVRQVLNLLATPEITFHLQVLENAIDYLARHTTRLRQSLAFKSLEKALDAAAAKDNPAEIRRIATLLLKPTPPLPDPEAEQAERAERITKHRRAVKNDARSEQKDAEYTALAAAMVTSSSQHRATDRLSSSGRCSVPSPSNAQAAPVSPHAPDTRPEAGRKPGLAGASVQPVMQSTPAAPVLNSPSHASPQHAPAQPRAA